MSQNNDTAHRARIDLLDGWRTLAVLCMFVWHFLWDLSIFGGLDGSVMQSFASQLARSLIAGSFVALSGISSRFSHDLRRRGGITLAAALAVTAVSWAMGAPVRFGILHLLGCCTLLVGLFPEREVKPRAETAMTVYLVLFSVWLVLTQNVRVQTEWLWLIGLRSESFSSADYYPLLPWLFLFLAGRTAGELIRSSDAPWKEKKLPRCVTWLGRHALAAYLLHQPILLGAAWLICR